MPTVTIYTTPSCGYCVAAKEFFKQHRVEYQEKDVAADHEARHEMIAKSQQMGVPVITIDDNVVVGFHRPALQELLGITEVA